MRLLYVVAVCFAIGAVGTVGCGKPKGGTTTGKGLTTGGVTPITTDKDTGKDTSKMTGKDTGKMTGKDTGKDTGKGTSKDTGKDTGKPVPSEAKGSVKIDPIDAIKIKKGEAKDVDVTIKVARKDYDKALKVEAKLDTADLKGVKLKTETADIKGDESTAKITLSPAKDASGAGELTITITGTDLKKVEAKAKVSVEK